MHEYTRKDLTVQRSDQGDGGWSIITKAQWEAARENDDIPEIVLSGPAERIVADDQECWSRPTAQDFEEALDLLNRR